MKRAALEPGLLSVFRLFATLQWFFVLIEIARQAHIAPRLSSDARVWSNDFSVFSFAATTILVVYLWLPQTQRWLGSLFLPIGLFIATVGAMIGSHFEFMADYALVTRDPEVTIRVWETTLLLFAPLLLIAWQYRFRVVLFFAVGTWLFDSILKWFAFGLSHLIVVSLGHLFLLRTLLYIVAGYMIVRLMTWQREQRQALARANAQLAQYAATLEQLATSRERNRLARELHDTLAHTLSEAAVELEAAKTLWDADPERARGLVERSLDATRSGLTETRRALQALRASPLEDLGLVLALRALVESVAAQTGAALDWHAPNRVDGLSPVVEQSVYRVAQESFENIVRHASANQITVRLSQADGQLALQISDDGRGFDPGTVDTPERLGLKGMRERAALIGGRLEIASHSGRGTTIRLVVEGKNAPRSDL